MTLVKKWRAAVAVFMVLAGAPIAQAAPFTVSLLPASGDIAGEPGTTIGWGYSIANPSSTDWLMLTDFQPDVFFHATEETLFLFPILGPGQTETVAFNAATLDGLFKITWDALAPVGFTIGGQFLFNAEFWDEDPFGTGAFLSFADPQSAAYSATVTAADTTPVPEPGTLLLTAAGFGVTGFLRRRRDRAAS